MPSHFRLRLLTAAIAMAAAASVCAAPAGNAIAGKAFVTLTNQHSNLLNAGDVSTGPLAFSQPMHIVVSLNLRNQAQLDSFVANAGKPETPLAQRKLTPEQFVAQYSPTQAQAQAVADYLTQAGFKNVVITPNRQLVTAEATADAVGSAFHTTFEGVRTHDGRNAYHNTSDAMIPAALQGTVRSVIGLNTVTTAHWFARRVDASSPRAAVTQITGTEVGHNPTDFAKIYGASSLSTASTIDVANIVTGPMGDVLNDVHSFESQNGLPLLAPVVEGPGNTGSAPSAGDDEWDLDVQDILGMSGGVKSITLYDAASSDEADLTTDFNLVVTDNKAKVINVSLGYCENNAHADGTTAADDAIFEQAVAQGQTFSVSTGDYGSNICYVNGLNGPGGGTGTGRDWPAASQYVIAAGGTALYTSGTTTWGGETVWNDGTYSATGGGPATYEAQPSWQSGVGQNAGHTTRGAPDIAFDADPNSGALVIVDGQANQQIGGTSLASPLFVGAWARIQAANGGNLGFAAPLIYRAAAANYATDFRDVTSGNNNGYTAAVGWDYTTGFGSLIVNQLSSNITSGSGTATHLGMTWASFFPASTAGLIHIGNDSTTNPYSGDTPTSTALPIACVSVGSNTLPYGITTDYYDGWTGGTVAFTAAVQGSQLTSQAVADGKCATAFGSGWRMAEFHDGGGGWSYWSFGTTPAGLGRFWVSINDQPANPWNTTTGAAMTWTVRTPTVIHVGRDNTTNPYSGDTAPSVSLPILCIDVTGSAVPTGITTDSSDGWASGNLAFTGAVPGSQLTSQAVANGKCAGVFGSGWRMAEFHDGGGGWSYWGYGAIPAGTTRFWTAIDDQPANPWD